MTDHEGRLHLKLGHGLPEGVDAQAACTRDTLPGALEEALVDLAEDGALGFDEQVLLARSGSATGPGDPGFLATAPRLAPSALAAEDAGGRVESGRPTASRGRRRSDGVVERSKARGWCGH